METGMNREYKSLKEEILYHTIRVIDKNPTIPDKKKEGEKERILEIIYGMNDPDRRHVKVKKIEKPKYIPTDSETYM